MRTLPLLLASLLGLAPLTAQSGLRGAAFSGTTPPASGYGSDVVMGSLPHAAIRYDVAAGATRVVALLAHVTLASDLRPSSMRADLVQRYPFLADPVFDGIHDWNTANSAFAGCPLSFLNPSEPLFVPPTRVRRFLDQYLANPSQVYGPSVTSSSNALYVLPSGFAATNDSDERYAFASCWQGTQGAFQVARLAQDALLVAARNQYPSDPNSASLAVRSLLTQDLLYQVDVQALEITPPSGTAGGKVKVKPRFRMRIRLLVQGDGWATNIGERRCWPSISDPAEWFHYADKSGYLAVEFTDTNNPQAQFAFVPLANGQWATVARATTSTTPWVGSHPTIAVFPLPDTAVNGHVYFTNGATFVPPRYPSLTSVHDPVAGFLGAMMLVIDHD